MRLIDADAFKERMTGIYEEYFWDVLDEMPTIDAFPVVRCKDCRRRYTFDCGMQEWDNDDDGQLRMFNDWTEDDGYCYWGERKDDA